MTQQTWERFAYGCAKDAHEKCFDSRRGTWTFKGLDVVVMYNKNPYQRNPSQRDFELFAFRLWLIREGIQELAYATYPEDGYSYAMVIAAGKDREEELRNAMTEIVLRESVRYTQKPQTARTHANCSTDAPGDIVYTVTDR